MQSIQQFFWLFCGAWVGIGNAVYFRIRLAPAIREGAITKVEADRFAAGSIGWIGGPSVLLWIIQYFFADSVTPFFVTWQAPYSTVATVLCVALWIVAFTWIWFLDGDRKMARIYTLARYQAYLWKHPIAFRIAIVLMIGGGVVGLLMQQRIEWPVE